ncbi:hypothetical protein ACFPPD_24490 [Cohnella suwonensis]|uniref:Solute-binding protein family 5 domain-containing protein n=1 Tax=Cohnella suwonensis TaxID=696072 RepID=A0ABW0M171_9BACL
MNASLEHNAQWIKKQCSAFGIAIEIIVLEYEELIQPAVIDQADMILANAIVNDDVEMSFLRVMLDDRSLVRRHLFDSIRIRVSELITDMQREPSSARRKEIVHHAERLLFDECGLLFLYHLKQTSYYHPMLFGVRLNPYGWVDFRDLALKPDQNA